MRYAAAITDRARLRADAGCCRWVVWNLFKAMSRYYAKALHSGWRNRRKYRSVTQVSKVLWYINDMSERDPTADIELDLQGLMCPMPLLKAKKALNGMAASQILHVTATDPGSERDFQVFAEQSGNTLLASSSQNGVYSYWIRKKA